MQMDTYFEFPTMLYVFGIQRKEAHTKQQQYSLSSILFLRCDWSKGKPKIT